MFRTQKVFIWPALTSGRKEGRSYSFRTRSVWWSLNCWLLCDLCTKMTCARSARSAIANTFMVFLILHSHHQYASHVKIQVTKQGLTPNIVRTDREQYWVNRWVTMNNENKSKHWRSELTRTQAIFGWSRGHPDQGYTHNLGYYYFFFAAIFCKITSAR